MWCRPLEWNLNGTTDPRDGSVDHLLLNSLKDRHGPIRAPKSLNIVMNRIDPDLFAACFMDWVRACWPDPLDMIAIDGKTLRRSHDRAQGRAALHLVSAFAANSHLVLGQEAVDDKTNETTAIPLL